MVPSSWNFPFNSLLFPGFVFNLDTLNLDIWLPGSVMCCVICSKQYVLLSILLCLLASGLVVFFLFPHSVLVDDDGIKVVKVTFNKQDSLVILTIMVSLRVSFPGLCTCQAGTQDTYTCFLTCPDVGHPENQELQLLHGGSDQPVQPDSVHEHSGRYICDY